MLCSGRNVQNTLHLSRPDACAVAGTGAGRRRSEGQLPRAAGGRPHLRQGPHPVHLRAPRRQRPRPHGAAQHRPMPPPVPHTVAHRCASSSTALGAKKLIESLFPNKVCLGNLWPMVWMPHCTPHCSSSSVPGWHGSHPGCRSCRNGV